MLRRSPIFKAIEPRIVSSGLQPDLHPLLKLLWVTADNVVFFAGRIKRRRNDVQLFDSGTVGRIVGLSQQRANNGVRWALAAVGRVAGTQMVRWYGPAAEAIENLGGFVADETLVAPATMVDFTHYGDWTIYNDSQGSPRLYKPAGPTIANYGEGLITGAAKLMKKLSFIMALGTGPRGTGVKWSDGSDIEVWSPLSTNSAGGLTMDDFDTRIRAGSRLGSSVSVFAEDQMGLVTYISAPFYFGQKVVLDGIGAVGKNAVASDGSNNLGVGRAGIWWTDGNSYRYIDEGYLHDYLQDNVNWAQRSKIFALRNDYTGCFEFYFPMDANLNVSEGWSYDPRTNGRTKLPLGPVLKDERRMFEQVISGGPDGKIYLDTGGATAPALALRTKPMLMQLQDETGLFDVHNSVRVDEWELLVKAAQSVQVRIGSSDDIMAEPTWDDWQDVAPDSKTYKQQTSIPDGVYHTLDFRSTAADWNLDMQGFMLFGQIDGTKLS